MGAIKEQVSKRSNSDNPSAAKPDVASHALTPQGPEADILRMQQTLGNQALQRWASSAPLNAKQTGNGSGHTKAPAGEKEAGDASPADSSYASTQASGDSKHDDSKHDDARQQTSSQQEKEPAAPNESSNSARQLASEPRAGAGEKTASMANDVNPGREYAGGRRATETGERDQAQGQDGPTIESSTANQMAYGEALNVATDQARNMSAPEWIVEDSSAEPMGGQIRKSEFLSLLKESVYATAEEALAGTGRTARDCPYISFWLGYYTTKDSGHIERAVRKYAPETQNAATSMEVISLILTRVRSAVDTWAATGLITGVPEDLPARIPRTLANESLEGAASGAEGNSFDQSNDAVTESDDPEAMQAQLGSGSPLEGSVRSRMESNFGEDFSDVRVHNDAQAAQLSSSQDARAFAVGNHVAFGAGEYRPGTVVGDAILAHELAHVAQQRGATNSAGAIKHEDSGYGALEEDADKSAESVITSLWGGARAAVGGLAQNAMPRLRSGLRLSRCGNRAPAQSAQSAQAAQGPASVTIAEVNAPNTPPTVKRIPPRVDTPVAVTVQGSPTTPVTLSIEDSGGGNGTATINGAATHDVTANETVNLKGVDQTEPGHSNHLKLVAKQGTNQLAASNTFSVAAYPVQIDFAFNRTESAFASPILPPGQLMWAALYDLSFVSDSGVPADCDKTTISENLLTVNAVGLFAGMGSITSGFLQTTSPQTDHHGLFGPNAAALQGAMSAANLATSIMEQDQFFRFACERSGIAEDINAGPQVPRSGFRITQTASNPGASFFLNVSKAGSANNGVAAGTSSDPGVKNVPV